MCNIKTTVFRVQVHSFIILEFPFVILVSLFFKVGLQKNIKRVAGKRNNIGFSFPDHY